MQASKVSAFVRIDCISFINWKDDILIAKNYVILVQGKNIPMKSFELKWKFQDEAKTKLYQLIRKRKKQFIYPSGQMYSITSVYSNPSPVNVLFVVPIISPLNQNGEFVFFSTIGHLTAIKKN